MSEVTSSLRKLVLVAGILCLIAGCSEHRFAGTYVPQIQLKTGAKENPKYSLEASRKRHEKSGPRKLELLSSGRYIFHHAFSTGDRIHEGQWWIEDDRLAIRCDTQNGRRLAKALISDGADKYLDIRDGRIIRNYNGAESNLELVFSRQ